MVIVASIYLKFYTEFGDGVGTFLPIPQPWLRWLSLINVGGLDNDN
jgi:hypothetical protein